MGTIHRLIEAKKAEREEEGKDAGFSLIELIVVVVILGILAVVAIPIFLNIQAQARDSAAKTAAANGATQASAALTQDPTATVDLSNLAGGDVTGVTFTWTSPNIDTICATAAVTGGTQATWKAGPGC